MRRRCPLRVVHRATSGIRYTGEGCLRNRECPCACLSCRREPRAWSSLTGGAGSRQQNQRPTTHNRPSISATFARPQRAVHSTRRIDATCIAAASSSHTQEHRPAADSAAARHGFLGQVVQRELSRRLPRALAADAELSGRMPSMPSTRCRRLTRSSRRGAKLASGLMPPRCGR